MKRELIVSALLISLCGLLARTAPAQAAACSAPTTNRGTVTATLAIPQSGTYRIWSRVMSGTAATDNSYSLEVDGSNCYTVGDNNGMTANAWAWVDYQGGTTTSKLDVTLSAGNHSFKMIGREDGVKLDRIIVTADTSCVPVGIGDNCANPPVVLTADFNHDNHVNNADFMLFTPSFGQQNATYDLTNDADHKVNIIDLSILLSQYGN